MAGSVSDHFGDAPKDVREWVETMAGIFVTLSKEQVDPPLRAFVLTFGGIGKLAETKVEGAGELMASLKEVWENGISDETKRRIQADTASDE